ncbi:MAG: FlgD immunoglobulin-like domain containing protein [Rhodothermales bacterium]
MRTHSALVLLVALAVGPPAVAQAGAGTWSLLDASPFHGYRFEDGSFLDPETGWIVNPDGEIWGTTDGGTSWTFLDQVPAYLRATVFVNEQHGFVGTLNQSNVLYETTDGATFTDITDRIDGPVPSGICGLWAVNEDVIYGVGWYAGPAHFVKTTDGGQTWTSRSMSEYVGSLVDVYFWDEERGIAVGGTDGAGANSRAVVLLTEDGGDTWSVRYTSPIRESGEWSWKITFPTPTTGYVSIEGNGDPAKVLKTTDAGVTWSVRTIPGSNDLQGLGFITENVGWASGRGMTSVTTDGGTTWSPLALDGSINRFEFFGDTLGYAMGHRIYTLARPTTTDAEGTPSASVAAITASFPNPFATATTIQYETDRAGDVTLEVHDVLGRRVATLAQGFRPPGPHEATWDGRAEDGRVLASGVYLVRLTAGDRIATHRVTLLR